MQLPLPSTSFSTSNTTSSTQENKFLNNDSKKNIFDYLVSYFENLRILGWNIPQTSIVRMEHSLRFHCSSLLENSGKNKFENYFNDKENIKNQNFWMKVFLSIFNFRLQSWPNFNFIFVFSSSLSSVSSFSSKKDLIIDGKEFEDFKFLKNDGNNQKLKNLVYENDNNINDFSNNNNYNNSNYNNEIRNSKKRNNTEIEIGNLSDYKNENREKKEKRKTEEKQRKKENQERIKLEIFEMEKNTNARIENKRKKEENNITRNFAEIENEKNHDNDINNNDDGGQNENLSTLHNIIGIFDFEKNASDRLVRTLKTAINQDFASISSSETNSLPFTDFQLVGLRRKFDKQNLLIRHDKNENENKFETKNEDETKNEKKKNDVNLFLLSCQNEKKKFQNLLDLAGKTGIAPYVQK